MPAEPKPQNASPITISTATIINGKYYRQGEALPFSRVEDLPLNLQPLVADGSEEAPFHPRERDFYNPYLAGQARRVRSNVQFQDWGTDAVLASNRLPAETEEALAASHAKHIDLAKAQAKHAQDIAEGVYQTAEEEAAAKESQQLFVRRGGEWAKTQNARLKPAEHVFARRPSGEYESTGIVDSEGRLPDEEIHI